MADIVIFVGTESGNAQMVGEVMAEELERLGHAGTVIDVYSEGIGHLHGVDLAIICCSTHGLGELPDNIIPLAEALRDARPDLSGLRYGVVALGDQTYAETFCKAGKDMDGLFGELGGRRLGDRLEVDACTQPLPDEDAIDWLKEWVTLI